MWGVCVRLEQLLALDPSREAVKETLEAVRHDLALKTALDTHLASRTANGQPMGGESKGDIPPPPPPPPSVSPPPGTWPHASDCSSQPA